MEKRADSSASLLLSTYLPIRSFTTLFFVRYGSLMTGYWEMDYVRFTVLSV
jgi:hypothetical protein